MKKVCAECGEAFVAEERHYYLCRQCYYASIGEEPPRRCAAIKDDGQPCRAWAQREEYFCGSHMRQGYGLFTLAVQAAERQSDGAAI